MSSTQIQQTLYKLFDYLERNNRGCIINLSAFQNRK